MGEWKGNTLLTSWRVPHQAVVQFYCVYHYKAIGKLEGVNQLAQRDRAQKSMHHVQLTISLKLLC